MGTIACINSNFTISVSIRSWCIVVFRFHLYYGDIDDLTNTLRGLVALIYTNEMIESCMHAQVNFCSLSVLLVFPSGICALNAPLW